MGLRLGRVLIYPDKPKDQDGRLHSFDGASCATCGARPAFPTPETLDIDHCIALVC